MSDLIAVTGATGGLGGRIARRLAQAGVRQRLVVRDPSRAPRLDGAEIAQAPYEDPAAFAAALDGAGVLMLISATEHPDRVALHTAAVDAAVAAGVPRIVYTSFLGAGPECTFTFGRDHWHTERHIEETGVGFTFLRDSLYLDFLENMIGDDGVIRGPAGDGRFAPVARADVAAVAATILQDPADHQGVTYDLTGPELLTMTDVARILSEARGSSVTFADETLDEAYASRERFGAPEWAVAGWVTSYAAVAAGELDVVTDHVEKVTGHPPLSLAQILRA
ncbi:NmrA family NAD(P)-binding protein [Herbidospora sp. NEAU-GS84]|uniref:NmrA family NAD(P)-binding protein n=1 Tax=Herbidospora solisilvae TaxID=2696284 RepID=A0A7C9JA71_9ACTN|nr:NmrA family NAD(P)-binding protein [Herbidospora solisilvae]NAS21164.1 NmrA family NAD(P)-binding protein [Herbidospora solisilvae]